MECCLKNPDLVQVSTPQMLTKTWTQIFGLQRSLNWKSHWWVGAHLRGDTVGLGLTVHIQALHDDGQLHLTRHISQRAHSHSQLLLRDEAIPVSVQNPKGLSDFYKNKAKRKSNGHMAWSIALKSMVTVYWKLLTAVKIMICQNLLIQ